MNDPIREAMKKDLLARLCGTQHAVGGRPLVFEVKHAPNETYARSTDDSIDLDVCDLCGEYFDPGEDHICMEKTG